MEPTCWYCDTALSPGESYWSIQAARETSADGRIDVETAEAWLTLCSGCAEACNLAAGPDIDWEDGRLTLLLAHEAAEPAIAPASRPEPTAAAERASAPAQEGAAPAKCPHCHKPVVAGDAFCMACGGAVQ